MNSWLIYSLLALLMWGFWALFPKFSIKYIDPKSSLIWEIVGVILVGIVILFMLNFKVAFHPTGMFFAMLTGVAGLLGALFFLYALSQGTAIRVIMITALYPLVAIILSFLILHETVTLKQGIGILFGLVSIVLLAL